MNRGDIEWIWECIWEVKTTLHIYQDGKMKIIIEGEKKKNPPPTSLAHFILPFIYHFHVNLHFLSLSHLLADIIQTHNTTQMKSIYLKVFICYKLTKKNSIKEVLPSLSKQLCIFVPFYSALVVVAVAAVLMRWSLQHCF